MAKQNIRVRKEPLPITTSANAGGKILAYRRRLAYLTDSGTASQLDSTLPSRRFETDIVEVRAIARQLVLAIESAANMLFSTSPRLKDEWKQSPRLFWAITCSVSCTGRIADQEPRKLSRSFARISETQFADKKSKEQVLYLESSRDSIDPGSEGKYWKFEDKHQVEAVLGLWVWSLKSDPAANAVDPREKWPKTASEPAAKAVDLGDRPKNAYAPILLRRIVCWDKSPEDMGFKLWFPSRFLSPRESKIFGSEQDTTSYTRWKVSGEEYRKFDWNEYRAWDTAHSAASVEGVMVRLFGWYGAELESLDSSGTGSCKVWTLPTKCTLLSLCAQEVFAVFVKCVLEVVQDIGEVGVQEEPNDIRFSNQLVSEVVEAFVDAQLGSREEALLCVLPQVLFEEARAGRTPLWHAAGNGQERMVNDLLHRAGRDIHLPDNKGRTPLCQAGSNGHEAVVKCLLKCGVDTNGDSQRKTPLSEAAANGHLAVVQVLLEEGTTNPDLKDDKGRTALWRAAASGHEAVVRLLLEEGASPDISDNSNVTSQSKASEEGHEGIVRILREHNEGLGSESLILGGRAFEKDQV
jgi:hypothetical protein